MKVAGLAVWGEAQRRTKLTDEQVPLSISALASALPQEQEDTIGIYIGTIGPDACHFVIPPILALELIMWGRN